MKKVKTILNEDVGDSTVVFDSNKNKIYTFGNIENIIWKNIDCKNKEELAKIILEEYEADYEQVLADVQTFIDQLIEYGLIER